MSEIYKDSSKPINERVADLLGRMTIEEKIGQLMQLDGGRGDLNELINEKQVGSLLHIQNEHAAKAMDMAGQTRLGIPILFGDDCIHGHSFHAGATIFPTQLAMACSWNPTLIEEAARVTAKEVRLTGLKWTFSPVLCLTRDLRWGRVGETFGEDPFLIGEFGCAMIRGYQGKGLDDPEAILACAKHYAGYSETQGGRDASEADLSTRKMRSYFLPPFERAAREGCLSFMTGYQSIDGLPSTANRWLLNDVLRGEWGFEGILVTDWDNVGRMHWEQKIVPTMKDAAALAIKSGNDLMMSTPGFYDGALEAIREGLVSESDVDPIVERLLALKFRLGLFEDPGKPDIARQSVVIGCEEHRRVNEEIARRSVVLLQNDGLLPLKSGGLKRIAVVGPNADDAQVQMGDWAGASGQVGWMPDGHPRERSVTVLEGVRALAGEGCEVIYAKGAKLTELVDAIDDGYDDGQEKRQVQEIAEPDDALIDEAVQAASGADVVVTVVGDNVRLCGECRSTATLEMQGGQLELLDALAKTGKPMVVVLINTKPLVLPKSVQKSAAIIEAFSPGMMGGKAIAEALFGAINPSGRLTVSIPYHVGQQPVYYSQVRGQHGDRYADLTQNPHFAFGYGLSYTTFEYTGLKLANGDAALSQKDTVQATITVKNTGAVAGRETVQAYVSDLVTSATWVNKELKAYRQIDLEPGESKTVTLTIPVSACSIVNFAGERVVEPGEFELQVGSSSRDQDLQKVRFVVA
ncbi:glycoside hydrolase family 3 N-terminal domain-containing protein [Cerasicoccus fimbriatus]|uniref:glycoside hydrolase family 3 N-terminal domain-containing protein n=1 Tax=Cerasicoccus fimbriatus TaxID=3014554 RepID=UPI0022B59C9B|nr:glycoside hydrolase family 3 N-terminal domain-containing protein [Cerasicoccus sp. TK19100]